MTTAATNNFGATNKSALEKTGSLTGDPTSSAHRTLPREIIKWIQGLDLSYSVKDYRKDMNNGFLIAQIFSRYHPGKIQMHSFDSSQNSQRRKNNWDLLELFFSKNPIGIDKKDYDRILHDDFNQLYDFICRIYTILTQRKLVSPPLVANVAATATIRSDNLTNAYLLKEKGLEKLDAPIIAQRENSEEEAEKPTVGPRKTILRSGSNRDQLGNSKGFDSNADKSGSPLRKSMVMRNNSNQHDMISHKSFDNPAVEERPANQKEIFDYLQELLEGNLDMPEYKQDKDLFPDNVAYTESFTRRLSSLSPQFTSLFLKQVVASREGFVGQLFRDQHEIWKFFAYFIDCLRSLQAGSEPFECLVELIGQFGRSCMAREPAKTKYIFGEYLLPLLGRQVQAAQSFSKRSEIIKIFYSFCGADSNSRKAMINSIKQFTRGNSKIFMSYLAVFVEFETPEEVRDSQHNSTRPPPILIEDFLYYANQYLFSPVVELRTMALKIYIHISRIHFASVLRNISGNLSKLAKTQWWENACQVITIIANLIERITNTREYVNLIKHPGNLTKCYNPENEKLSNQMKEEVEELAKALQVCSKHPNEYVRQVLLACTAPILSEHKILLKIFVSLFLRESVERRQQILNSEEVQAPDEFIFDTPKSQKLRRVVNSTDIKRCAGEVLPVFVEWVGENNVEALSQPMLELINFSLSHINLKSLSMDTSENICGSLSQLILVSACTPQLAEESLVALQQITLLYFYSEVKIRDFVELVSAAIALVVQKDLKVCKDLLDKYFMFLKDQHSKSGNDSIMHFIETINIEVNKRSSSSEGKSFMQKHINRQDH